MVASESAAPARRSRRTMLRWTMSLLGGGVLLWLVSRRMPLWPGHLVVDDLTWLIVGIALYGPYSAARAWRASAVLDPLVANARDGRSRIRRTVLFGSGFVSFFLVFLLPFRLGELSRPALLAKAGEPGIGWPEGLATAAAERVLDGLLVCGMLFLGLATADHVHAVEGEHVRPFGAAMGGVFVAATTVLVLAGRHPHTTATAAARAVRAAGPTVARRVEGVVLRLARSLAPLFALSRGGRFMAWSLVYWALAVAQLACVAHGVGIALNGGAAMTAVAVIALAIQLPGGPAQIGSFQVGTLASLTVLVPDLEPSRAATFAAVLYALQWVGTAITAVVGLVLVAITGDADAPRP